MQEGVGPFDLTFIDADKIHSPDYFAWSLEHSRPGSLIICDNVVRFGRLADPANDEPTIQAQRRLHEHARGRAHGSRRRRFRPSAPRATTVSTLHLSLPEQGLSY